MALADLLLPPLCVHCGSPLRLPAVTLWLCEPCRERLLAYEGAICRRCANPLPGRAADQAACIRCQKRKYRFHDALAYGIYRGPLRLAVVRAKRVTEEPLAFALGTLLAQQWLARRESERPDMIAAMPTHWRRRWQRGGNGAEMMAQAVARRLAVPCEPHLLRTRRVTQKQGTLTPTERLRNVQNAYGTCRGASRKLDGAHVLLIDDVMTTGATASEAARTLRQQGAARISVAVVARAVGDAK